MGETTQDDLTVGYSAAYPTGAERCLIQSKLEVAERLGYLMITPEIEALAVEIARMLGSMLKKYGSIS